MGISQKGLAHISSHFLSDRNRSSSNTRKVYASIWWIIVTLPRLLGSLGCIPIVLVTRRYDLILDAECVFSSKCERF